MSTEGESRPCATETLGPAGDTLDLLAGAISSYLDEIEGYRQACLRHERTTVLQLKSDAIRLTKRWQGTDAVTARLRKAVNGLPGWERSPLWSRRLADRTLSEVRQATTDRSTTRDFLADRGIAWEGRPIFVLASCGGANPIVGVDLLLPSLPGQPPEELPLRQVAIGLACYDALLPESLATPLPVMPGDRPGSCSVIEFLSRATPQTLYAGKCFSPHGAEQ